MPNTAIFDLRHWLSRVKMLALLELVGFAVIFTAIIAIHFAGDAWAPGGASASVS